MNIALITRPAGEAPALAAAVAARGLTPLSEPMLTIEPVPGPEPDVTGAQALLFTSANGVRAFGARTNDRSLPVLAVGDATAAAAKESGFSDVTSADGAVGDLAALVARTCSPAAGRLIHAAGADVAGDLGAMLAPAGFRVERLTLYAARPARRFSAELTEALARGTVRLALFFSPRSGAAFATLLADAGQVAKCDKATALCLSPAVADSIGGVRWRTVAVAARPTRAAMMDLIDRECARIRPHDP